MDRPPFTAEQLAWLRQEFPTGLANRILADVRPSTDAQEAGAYALLTAEQRKAVDDQIAADKAAADLAAAQAALDAANAAQAAAQAAVEQATAAVPADAPTTPEPPA